MTDSPRITVSHSGDGTTVEGTTRVDAATIKKVGGFKWSRNIGQSGAWYLPRNWREPTRLAKARALVAAFDGEAELVLGSLAKSLNADEQAAAHVARREELAGIHADKAVKLDAEADALAARSHAETAGIPFGQPILVGHHSEGRHRRALDKSWSLLGKSVEASREADRRLERAESAAAEAASYDEPARVGRRIKANRAELGRWERNLAPYVGKALAEVPPGSREWVERANIAVAELRDKIARDLRVLEESGVTAYSKDTIKAGDLVKIRGSWHSVDKANPKTVAITSHGLALTYDYSEVQGHREVTEDELHRHLAARQTSDLQASLRSRRSPANLRSAIEKVLAERAALAELDTQEVAK